MLFFEFGLKDIIDIVLVAVMLFYAYRLMNNPRDIVNKHYTELLFESQFDWNLVFYQLGSMWSGEYGPWLAEVFA